MFQFAFEAVLSKFTYEASQFAPLLQLPPTRAQTAQGHRRRTTYPYFFIFCYPSRISGEGVPRPLTGGAATYGVAVKNGAQIAIDEINAKGGVQFEMQFEDDEQPDPGSADEGGTGRG